MSFEKHSKLSEQLFFKACTNTKLFVEKIETQVLQGRTVKPQVHLDVKNKKI